MTITISEFLQFYDVDPQFNEIEYLNEHPRAKEFYIKYCQENNIDEKHRLFFHYYLFFRPDKLKYIKELQNILLDLIDLNIDSIQPIVKKYITKLVSSLEQPFHCDNYLDRKNHLEVMEKLIPYLPEPNFNIQDKHII